MRYCTRCGARYEAETYCPEDGSRTELLAEAVVDVDPMLGMVVDGRYRVDRKIGEGGMGVVYLATHTVLGKKLALKILRSEMARDAEVVQRFMQEAQSASSIGHPNIIDINDFGRLADGSVYFVMEYLEGESLTSYIQRGGSIPIADALAIVRQIASALGAAHARGIVHRDLKPDNIQLVSRQSGLVVKILDFGIAKVGGASSKLTRTGVIFGTPHYMAPEQAAGQSVDGRTDLYALGCILYEMFTGRVPFDADTFMGILSKHMFEVPARPTALADGTRLGVYEDVVMRMLAKKPEQRYASMEEFSAELDRVSAGGRATAFGRAAPGLADVLEPQNAAEAVAEERHASSSSAVKKAPTLAIVAGVIVLVCGAGGAYLLFGSSREPVAATAPAASGVTASAVTPTLLAPVAPVVPPVVNQPVAAQAPASIEMTTEPPGAEILIEGAFVGNAPVSVPRPASGERIAMVRMTGYEEKKVVLSASSPPRFELVLERAARPRAQPTKRPTSPPTTPTKQSRNNSELADPWQ